MLRRVVPLAGAVLLLGGTASAVLIGGGAGSRTRDCVAALDVPGANKPAPPKTPTAIDCVDGDPTCDADGTRNAACVFPLRVCLNSTAFPACTPSRTDAVDVEHAVDNGDRRFDTDFQAIQSRIGLLDLPDDESLDDCTLSTSIGVALVAPASGSGPWKFARKKLKLIARGVANGRPAFDHDRLVVTCRPAGDAIYGPRDLYSGTFDRITREIFAPRCAIAAFHDSNGHQANEILLPNVAWSQIVGVTPTTPAAAADGLLRVFPGDPERSLLYRKITFDLLAGYGAGMPALGAPLTPAQTELIRLWIIGDGVAGPAPETGWVAGTDS